MRDALRRGLLMAVAATVLGGCGEPPVDVDLPPRAEGQQLLDTAGVLRAEAVDEQLGLLRDDGLDVVALTYETDRAGCGEAFRAGGKLVETWDADVAIVAVARPGDFGATGQDRTRCLGIHPRDQRAVPGGLRERIVEELVPPLTRRNEWTEAFVTAAAELGQATP